MTLSDYTLFDRTLICRFPCDYMYCLVPWMHAMNYFASWGFLCIRDAEHTVIKITEGMVFYLLNWQVESQLAVAEEITFPYVWGTYDLLILPPSFPYGGMENPCLTFVTPTLLVGEGVRCLSINILCVTSFCKEIMTENCY